MVDLIKNTNFSIQFVLDKINANEPRKQPEEEEQQHPQLETDQGSGEATNQLEGFEAKVNTISEIAAPQQINIFSPKFKSP